jgi:RNA polymerase sigma-70 factor (ECF subfamily)
MSKASEASLISRAVRGDEAAFGELVGRHHGAIFNLAFRMLQESDEAEGVTQTVFVKAYEKLPSYDFSYKFFSWIYRIAVNESIDRLEQRKKMVALDPELVSGSPTPEENRAAQELVERIDDAVDNLPSELRVVIIMRHFEDLSYREMAYVLGIPEKTVKSRLYSARRRLAGYLVERGVRSGARD